MIRQGGPNLPQAKANGIYKGKRRGKSKSEGKVKGEG